MKKVAWGIVPATLLALTLSSPAEAALITYDFGTTTLGGLTTYTETEGGVTLTLARETGTSFSITSQGGSHMLDPFVNVAGAAFIANFSSLINGFQITAGDYVPSDLDTLVIQAYSGANGTGTLLASFSQNCCEVGTTGTLGLVVGAVSASNIASVRFIGGNSSFPNSVYYDNIVINAAAPTPVPEPASMLLLGTGLLGAGVRRWRQKRA